jgi:Ca-activated chloride channel family protein
MFRFETPYALVLLVSIPLIILYQRQRVVRPVMGISSVSSVRQLASSPLLKIKWLIPFMKYTALGLLILAMARPQWGTQQISVLTEGINIVLAVDLSESMAALDFKQKGKIVNRLEAIKEVAGSFVAGRKGDRIGLVVFGDHAYTQLPLTRDYSTISSVLDRLDIGAAGRNTAIGDAIGISLKRLEDIKSKSNIIILLTDGQSNAGQLSPEAATEISVQKKVKIYTIGVGTRGKAPYLVRDPVFGDQYFYQQVNIDEATLKMIAEKTGGLYFRAENFEGLKKIYDTIDRLEKTKINIKTYAEYREYYRYLLIPAFILFGLWIVLTNTRFLSVP